MSDYKIYKDKRGNTIEFIDGKWQMYDDGGYYVLDESSIPAELLTPAAKAKADSEYLRYISEQHASAMETRKRTKAIEESLKKTAPGNKEGMTIKSQVKGWEDWSTSTLPPKARKAAEWLIANGFADQKDVQSVFYDRQTSSTSDDFRAEEHDNNAIIKLAEAYKIKKSKEPAEPAPFGKAMRKMLQSQKDNGTEEKTGDMIDTMSRADFDKFLDRDYGNGKARTLGLPYQSDKKGGEKKMSTEKASEGKRYTQKEKRDYFGRMFRGEESANPKSKYTAEQQKFIALGRKIELDRSARITARRNATETERAEYDAKNAQFRLDRAKKNANGSK